MEKNSSLVEAQPFTPDLEAHENNDFDVAEIRKELLEFQQKERDREIGSGHLLDVDLGPVTDEDLLFWKRSTEPANKVRDFYKNPEQQTEVDFWALHDATKDLEEVWHAHYHRRQQDATGDGKFVAFLANSFVLANGYMSIIEKDRNHKAVEQLSQFQKQQSDSETAHRTAYLADTRIEDLLESDLYTYQLLRAVEEYEEKLSELNLLDRAQAYAYGFDEVLLSDCDQDQKNLITQYASLSARLRRQWDSWHDVEKLDRSRYDFYNYVGNRVNVIGGNQELG